MITMLASLAMLQSVAAAKPSSPPTPPPACDTPAHSGFDFWIGEWDVFPNGGQKQVARSKIEKLYAGCAIRENWMPLQGAGGGSFNSLDPVTGRWHQTWVGSSPGRVEFEGGMADGKMVLNGYWAAIGGPGKDGLVRMTYTAQDPDTVRQHGEVSYDYGLSWTTSFDLIYRRREENSQ